METGISAKNLCSFQVSASVPKFHGALAGGSPGALGGLIDDLGLKGSV